MNKVLLAEWLTTDRGDFKKALAIYKKLGLDSTREEYYNNHKNLGRKVPDKIMALRMLQNDLVSYARIHNIKPSKNGITVIKKIPKNKGSVDQKVISPSELKKLMDNKKIQNINPVPPVQRQLSSEQFDSLSPEKQEIYTQLKVLYKMNSSLHANMKVATSSSMRAEYLASMLENEKQISILLADFDDRKLPGSEKPKITKPSGRYTLDEIEAIEDPGIRIESKLMRIEANQKYISRNAKNGSKKQLQQVEIRKSELKYWGVND